MSQSSWKVQEYSELTRQTKHRHLQTYPEWLNEDNELAVFDQMMCLRAECYRGRIKQKYDDFELAQRTSSVIDDAKLKDIPQLAEH